MPTKDDVIRQNNEDYVNLPQDILREDSLGMILDNCCVEEQTTTGGDRSIISLEGIHSPKRG
jgi:hypothetical protein